MTTENRKWPLVVLTVCVICMGAAMGGIFGLVAGGVYATAESVRHHWLDRWWAPLGTVLGGIGGGAAGWLWTCRVWRLRDRRGIRIVAEGVGWGIVAGLAATVLLHAGLWAAGTDAPEMAVPLVGFILAVPAGAVTGLACGCVAWRLAAWLRWRLPAAAAPGDSAPPNGTGRGTQANA
ncbi:MAG: hypothetical protein NTX87_00765 [Planctomycetota bacterium]|nr:hypothetical protein [Planctomycetota bacterium]